MPTSTVWVTFTGERLHRWPKAPLTPIEIHLRELHRHLFYVRIEVGVTHDDRDVSFEQLRAEAQEAFGMTIPAESTMSCESMAAAIGRELLHFNLISVTVSEDGESGAIWRPGDGPCL